MHDTHSYRGGQLQRLLWAIGEAHRHRCGVERVALPSTEAEAVGTPSPAGNVAPISRVDERAPAPSLRVEGRGGRVALRVTGELDGFTAADFLDRVLALIADGAHSIVVDLGGVEVIDSQGVAALVSAQTLLESLSGELVLRSPRSRTLKLLDAAGLGDRFVIC